ncbi:MAG: porin [Pelagibacteraceae bacterium]|nr:porin [Pelagibacteraceae bacterium]
MTNLKKVGLTALAGSLAAIGYAQAGALDVSGIARMEYQSTQASTTSKSDAFSNNTSISFSGSGELDNGMSVSYFSLMTSTRTSSSQSVALDMGDAGKITMSDYNMAGIGMIQDKVPNGGEQPWDDNTSANHGTPEVGVASPHSGDRLGYINTFGGVTVSAAIDYQQNSPTTSIAVSMPLMEGLEIGAGMATDQSSATTEQEIETAYVKYTMGGISVGYQTTEVDVTAANSDIERTAYGVSFAVNDNLSIGYGVSDTEFDALTPDEENVGIGIAYTSGGIKLGIINNTKDNPEGVAGAEEMTEFQLTFAF